MVNLLGERFYNEGTMGNTTFTGNAISHQKNRTAFVIFDDAIKRHMETVGFDDLSRDFPFKKIDDLDVLIKTAIDGGLQEHRFYAAHSGRECCGICEISGKTTNPVACMSRMV